MPGYLTRDMSTIAKQGRPALPAPTKATSQTKAKPFAIISITPRKKPTAVVRLTPADRKAAGPIIVDKQQHERHQINKFAQAILRARPSLSADDLAANADRLKAMNLEFRARWGVTP